MGALWNLVTEIYFCTFSLIVKQKVCVLANLCGVQFFMFKSCGIIWSVFVILYQFCKHSWAVKYWNKMCHLAFSVHLCSGRPTFWRRMFHEKLSESLFLLVIYTLWFETENEILILFWAECTNTWNVGSSIFIPYSSSLNFPRFRVLKIQSQLWKIKNMIENLYYLKTDFSR